MLKIEYKLGFNGLNNMSKKKKIRINFTRALVVAAIFVITCSVSIGATYYVDPVKGLDTNAGTSAFPWKTFQKATTSVIIGDTCILRSGNYGDVTIGSNLKYAGFDKAITFKADTGASALLNTVTINGASGIILDGLKIQTPGDKVYTNGIRIVTSSYLKILNCLVGGTSTVSFPTYSAISIDQNCSNIVVDKSDIYIAYVGVEVNGKDITISNTKIHYIAGSGIKCSEVSNNVLALNNTIYDQYPNLKNDDAHGSGLSIRCRNFTARNNTIYNFGNTAGIRTYQDVYDGCVTFTTLESNITGIFNNGDIVTLTNGKTGQLKTFFVYNGKMYFYILRNTELNTYQSIETITSPSGAKATKLAMVDERSFGGYQNIILENNLVYNCISTPVWLTDIGNNFVVNNNTFVGTYDTAASLGYKFAGALSISFIYGGDGSGLKMNNNILVGYLDIHPDYLAKIQESKNIIWAIREVKNLTFLSCITATSTSTVICNTKTTLASAAYTADMFTVKDKFFTSLDGTEAYNIVASAKAVGFANPLNASLADITGLERDIAPDAGCYEYMSGTTIPEPNVTPEPNIELVIASIDAKTVTEGQALGFDVVVTGAAANLITCTIENLPVGATFTNKHFQWTPKSGQAGLYFLKINATCGDANATRYVAVTVQQNTSYHTPTFGVFLGTSVFEAEQLSVVVSATDPDGDKLMINALNLPAGAIFYDNKLIWVPDYGTAGTYKVQFTASDGINSASTEVSIIIKKAATETYPGKRLIYYWQTTLSLLGKI